MSNRNISKSVLNFKIESQEHLCAYCQLPFGSIIQHRMSTHIANVVGDHFIPWAYSGTSEPDNFVASCSVCNGIKSDKHFSDLQSASRFILEFRVKNKYVTQFIPNTPVSLDYLQWQREYSAWLSGE